MFVVFLCFSSDPRHVSDAVSQLQTSMQQMLSLLQFQQREIESIRSELQSKEETGQVMTNLQAQMDSLEHALASRVAASLSEHTQSEGILWSRIVQSLFIKWLQCNWWSRLSTSFARSHPPPRLDTPQSCPPSLTAAATR